jgi:hypothetical protein
MTRVAVTLVLLGLAGFGGVAAQGAPPGEPPVGPGGVTAVKVQGNVWMLAGAGGNIAVQAGDEACWWSTPVPRDRRTR